MQSNNILKFIKRKIQVSLVYIFFSLHSIYVNTRFSIMQKNQTEICIDIRGISSFH